MYELGSSETSTRGYKDTVVVPDAAACGDDMAELWRVQLAPLSGSISGGRRYSLNLSVGIIWANCGANSCIKHHGYESITYSSVTASTRLPKKIGRKIQSMVYSKFRAKVQVMETGAPC